MKHEDAKALFIIATGLAIFWIMKPKRKKLVQSDVNKTNEEPSPTERSAMKEPTIDKKDIDKNPLAKNAFGALKAYVKAYNNKEPQSVLDELNREFAKEFKVKVLRRKSDNKLVAYDLQGNEIIVNNA
jgi:hypothetical protein